MLPGSPDLPPGCTDAMIERRFGGPETCTGCDGTGELNRSACCGVTLHGDYQDNLICPRCGEDCERENCERCGGSGEEPDTQYEPGES